MADTYIALLRGINVGGAKRVPMAELKSIMEGLGFGNVRTLLNSGNVVFTAPRGKAAGAEARIRKAVEDGLGVSARVMVISSNELSAVVEENPLLESADNPSRLFVGILGDAADRQKLAATAAKDWGKEKLAHGPGRAFYMWLPDGAIASALNAEVSKVLRDGVTARNWATILKLHAMCDGS